MLFSVGYNFAMSKSNRMPILKIAVVHAVLFLMFCVIIQLGLTLIGNVAPQTRWAILLFCTLPGSYLAPTLARTEEEAAIASGVCSVLTVPCLLVFCVMAAFLA